jgi:hypothetical protein
LPCATPTIVTSTPGITGTQNLPYQITDGRNNLVIDVPVKA